MESWCYFSGDKEHVCDKSVSASGENGGKKSEKQSSCLVVETNSKDSSLVDLKLGSTSDRNETLSLNSSYAAAKRPRPGVWSSQIPFCLVHGCKKDLRSSKEYYKRHKVCEVHSKTAKVIVNGVEQRFCQQCSRFHVLTEFDNEKRSCRRRLAGHNERRRKPRVGVNSTRLGMFQNYNGSTFQDTYSRSSNVLSQQKYEVYDWNRPVKVENGADFCSQIDNPVGSEQLHSKSVPISDTSRKQHFPFHVENSVPTRSKIDEINELSMQDHATGSDIGCPPLIFHNSVGSKNAMLMDSSSYILDLSGTLNSGHALSLLSSLSQDSSNLSSRAHSSSQPFSTSDSSASYDLSKVSQKLLAVSNGASTTGMSRVSHSSLRPLSEHHW